MSIQNLARKIAQECEPYMEEYRKQIFSAEVLNCSGENICRGKAHLEAEKTYGVFWPNTKQLAAKESEAAILQHENGREFVVRDFQLCLAGGDHYHFHFKQKN